MTTALYDAGYGSSSRLYERTASHLGMTPSAYRRGGAGLSIRYDVLDTPIGKLLVAATGKGVCAIQFGDSGKKLEGIPAERVSRRRPAARFRVSEPVGRAATRALGRQTAEAGRAARYPSHRLSAARVGVSANHPLRQHAVLWRDREGHPPPTRGAGRGAGMRLESSGGGCAVPPCGARRWPDRRIPLGCTNENSGCLRWRGGALKRKHAEPHTAICVACRQAVS